MKEKSKAGVLIDIDPKTNEMKTYSTFDTAETIKILESAIETQKRILKNGNF